MNQVVLSVLGAVVLIGGALFGIDARRSPQGEPATAPARRRCDGAERRSADPLIAAAVVASRDPRLLLTCRHCGCGSRPRSRQPATGSGCRTSP